MFGKHGERKLVNSSEFYILHVRQFYWALIETQINVFFTEVVHIVVTKYIEFRSNPMKVVVVKMPQSWPKYRLFVIHI